MQEGELAHISARSGQEKESILNPKQSVSLAD